ncbi:MAG: hypothetical protein M1820_007398 [Bogoriella megaspora]|nr:MAG: hypothetical protein M1820_007398 [Bogoriella megaspora]
MISDIIFVPGICSVGSIVYKALTEELEKIIPSTKLHIIDLPSVDAIATNANLEPNGFQADLNAVGAQIKPLVDAGKSVLIVAHSYGGTPALYASEGLWKTQRTGQTGGVVKIALLSSSLALPGGTVAGDREAWKKSNGQPEDPMPQMQQHGKELFIIPTGFEHAWMNDVTDEAIRASLKPSPLSTVLTPTPEADVKIWDIAYLATTDIDLGMAEAFQKHLADRARESGAKVQYKTIKSGHFVQVSHAKEVAEWVQSLVGDSSE